MDFYDQGGNAVAYSSDGENIYLWAGQPVAYIRDDKVYSFPGRLLGWMRDGWLIDRDGNRALFTENATGGPVKPVKKVRPVKGVRRVRPVKGVRQTTPVKPVTKLQWGLRPF